MVRNPYTAWLCMVLFALSGCGSLDRKPETVLEGLYVSAAYGTALARSVNGAYASGFITKSQQLDALDTLQEAKDAVDAGLQAHAVGNYAAATTRLDKAESTLRIVALLLSKYGGSQ